MNQGGRCWGAQVTESGVRFRVWAPPHQQVCVRLEETGTVLPMTRLDGGWHELVTAAALPGTRYRYLLADGRALADPASLYQPDGIDGPSEVPDLSQHAWKHPDWTGRPWHEAVVYELHVGTFTPAGTFQALIDRLPHLVALGVTAIELMPVATFPGTRNWGYDGVFPYAPAATYGGPGDLQALVDAAHGAGLMVFADVVYNHFGPRGNVMYALAPSFFTDTQHTPWGPGFDFEAAPVRSFFIENALHWIECYRMDGLRLDAVHAIRDASPQHIIDVIARTVKERFPDRHVHLILENEHNEAGRLVRHAGRPVLFTAQWNDDVHHGLHVAATSEASGYYADYAGDFSRLARSLAEGFAFQGEIMRYSGRPRGEPSAHLPPLAFISFLQNHDQIGNRALGERLATLIPGQPLRALAAVQLLLPQIPMLFMGEEWAAGQPFAFFCDFEGALGQAVVAGRREEFARFPEFSDPLRRASIPDPTDVGTFARAKLDWSEAERSPGCEHLRWYQQILSVRHREIIPRLPRIDSGGRYHVSGDTLIEVVWSIGNRERLHLAANLGALPVATRPGDLRHVIWREGTRTATGLGPWTVEWSLVDPDWQEGG